MHVNVDSVNEKRILRLCFIYDCYGFCLTVDILTVDILTYVAKIVDILTVDILTVDILTGYRMNISKNMANIYRKKWLISIWYLLSYVDGS